MGNLFIDLNCNKSTYGKISSSGRGGRSSNKWTASQLWDNKSVKLPARSVSTAGNHRAPVM